MIAVQCPNPECGKTYRFRDDKVCKSIRCKCGRTLPVVDPTLRTIDHARPPWMKKTSPDADAANETQPDPPPVKSNRGEPHDPTEYNAAPPQSPSAALPKTIDRFEILSQLGEGAFGIVYRARDPLMNREVALKLPKAVTFESEESLTRFVREAQAAGRLAHPNIVTVYEVVANEKQIYIASEFIQGETLEVAIKRRNIGFAQAVEIARRLADALDYAHNKGIIHRDIKPANIILDADGQPHLLDFGLAKLDEEIQKLTLDGTRMGTPAYMSPEQARGDKSHNIGPASDQYSLGVVLYEMLTGRRPFIEADTRVLFFSIQQKEPPKPRSIKAGIPLDLETICLKTLSKESPARYASCAALAADLQRWQQDLPIQARRIGPAERFKRWCKRNPVVAGLAASVFLVFLLGSITSTVFAVKANRRAEAERIAKEKETEAKNKTSTALKKAVLAEGKAASATVKEELERYYNLIGQADKQTQRGDLLAARALLDKCPKKYRDWEWAHLLERTSSGTKWISGGKILQDLPVMLKAEQGISTLWDVRTRRQIGKTRIKGVRSVSPHSRYVVTWGTFEESTAIRVKFFESATGKEVGQAILSNDSGNAVWGPAAIDFSQDELLVAIAGFDWKTHIYKLDPFTKIATLSPSDQVVRVVFNNTSDLIATAEDSKRIVLWRRTPDDKWKPTIELTGHLKLIRDMTFSLDGSRIATCSDDGTARIWDVSSGKQLVLLSGHEKGVESLSFSKNGDLIATVDRAGTVRVWNSGTGDEIFKRFLDSASRVFFNNDGSCVIATQERDVYSWRLSEKAGRVTFPAHSVNATSVAIHPTVAQAASGGSDGIVIFWSTSEPSRLSPSSLLAAHEKAITSVRYSYSGQKVLTASLDGSIKLWNYRTGKRLLLLNGHQGSVYAAEFASSKYVVSAGADRKIIVWDLKTGRPKHTISGHDVRALAIGRSSNKTVIIGGTTDSEVIVWRFGDGQKLLTMKNHTAAVYGVAVSPNEDVAASGGADRVVRLWNIESGQLIRSFHGHGGTILGVNFSPDGSRLLSASRDGTIKVWDVTSGRVLQTLRHATAEVVSVAMGELGRFIMSSGSKGGIYTWDTRSGGQLQQVSSRTMIVSDLQVDGTTYISTATRPALSRSEVITIDGKDGIRVSRTLHDANRRKVLVGSSSPRNTRKSTVAGPSVNPFVRSPDGRLTATLEGTLRARSLGTGIVVIRNSQTKEIVSKLTDGLFRGWSFAFSPNGKRIACGSGQNSVTIWDVKTGHLLLSLDGNARVRRNIFSLDGNSLATQYTDGTITIWKATSR